MAEEKRCWLYTRIDAPEDAHGCLKAQEKELLDFAAKEGYEVAGAASDLGSGLNMERPGLARVMQAVKEKDFSILLVKGIDRLGRDTDKVYHFLTELQINGISVHSPHDGKLDISDNLREFFMCLKALPELDESELEAEDRAEMEDDGDPDLLME